MARCANNSDGKFDCHRDQLVGFFTEPENDHTNFLTYCYGMHQWFPLMVVCLGLCVVLLSTIPLTCLLQRMLDPVGMLVYSRKWLSWLMPRSYQPPAWQEEHKEYALPIMGLMATSVPEIQNKAKKEEFEDNINAMPIPHLVLDEHKVEEKSRDSTSISRPSCDGENGPADPPNNQQLTETPSTPQPSAPERGQLISSETLDSLTMEDLFFWAVRNNSHLLLSKLLEINDFAKLRSKLTQMHQNGQITIHNSKTLKILKMNDEMEETGDVQLTGSESRERLASGIDVTDNDTNSIDILQINAYPNATPEEHREVSDSLGLKETTNYWSTMLARSETPGARWQVKQDVGMYNGADWKNYEKITNVSPEEAAEEAARRGCKGFTYCKSWVNLGQYGSFDRKTAILYMDKERALVPQLGSAPGQCDYYYYSVSEIK